MPILVRLLAALLLLSGPVQAGPPLLVVELFTSQGCSSCPPADALLGRISREDGVLALSLHVDYWDYLGWRDRFARPENTVRQKAYTTIAHARSIYTPQAVVQGVDRIVGSDEDALRAALARHRAETAPVSLSVRRQDDAMQVEVTPSGPTPFLARGILHLVTYDQPQTVRIDRGENAGRTMVYVNVVRDWMRLGAWDGQSRQIWSAPMPEMGRGVAVILQDGPVGEILAAARLEFGGD